MIELTPQEIVDTVMQVFGDQVAFRNYENDIAFGNAIVAKATAKLLMHIDDNAKRAIELLDANVELAQQVKDMQERKDGAYEERNRLVALLASMAVSSGLAKTAIEGWHPSWHNCVYIDTNEGQLSWHFHDSQMHLFEHLPPYTKPWDGHTTEEKYKRIEKLAGAIVRPAAALDLFEAKDQVCPHCHATLERPVNVTGDYHPKEGDGMFCFICGNVSVFEASEDVMRKPTEDEIAKLENNEGLMRVRAAWREHHDRNMQ